MNESLSLRILIVDDAPEICLIAQLALERVGGFTVQTINSGTEALDLAPRFAPDLILLDVVMPDLDGPETLRELRSLPALSSTPIIFLTAKDQAQDIAQLKGLGAIAVLVKPFDPLTLSATIRKIWEDYNRSAAR